MTARRQTALAALAGLVAAAVTLGVAEVVSLFLGGIGNPLLSVGSFVIDIVPAGVKSAVIALFGTGDKIVLGLTLLILVLVLAGVIGVLQYRRPPLGMVGLALVAVIALATVATRADVTPLAIAPTLVATALGLVVLRTLTRRLHDWAAPATRGEALKTDPRKFERRKFLQLAVAAGVVSVVVGVGARVMNAASEATQAVRAALKLPAAASVAPAAAAEPAVTGISPFVVPNDEFYRIDTALQVPSVDPSTWELKITGMVENEITITYDELSALPLEEHYVTLSCVSNEVGGYLVGNAKWLGYPIREYLARAKPLAGADMVLSRSIDGFTAGTPIEVLQDPDRAAIFAIGMNDELLPLEHGFPVRMVVPGLYGYVSATKWVVELKVTTFAADQGYWTPRGWDALGPVKLESRIDTPVNQVAAGTVPIAGVAWSPHVGVAKVEVQIDDGDWVEANLAPVVDVDAWLQWWYTWDAPAGNHDIRVRATDNEGYTQTSDYAPPAPNGASGWHEVSVQVA